MVRDPWDRGLSPLFGPQPVIRSPDFGGYQSPRMEVIAMGFLTWCVTYFKEPSRQHEMQNKENCQFEFAIFIKFKLLTLQ
jgi:hypothetical protein